MSDLVVRPLEKSDDRSEFRSGNPDLDRFFHRYAGQNQFKHHIGTTYIALEEGVIVGFATVSPSHIELDDLPRGRLRKRLPAYPLPILRLARLAVSEDAQGRGVGSALMRAIFHLALELRERVGCIGVVVDAKPVAEKYYARLGFEPLNLVEGSLGDRPEPVAMFLPISGIPK